MFCFILALATLVCGIFYLVMGYQILVGLVQVLLGSLCIALVIAWWHSTSKTRKRSK